MPIIENLEQYIEHLGVGLFYFVQQDAAVGLAAHTLGELSALVIAHVTGRRTYQPGHGVSLLELRHVQPNHGVFAAEHEL